MSAWVARRPGASAFAVHSILLAALAFPAGAETADGAPGEAAARGLALAAEGRCEEALPLLARASADVPDLGRIRMAEAQCRIRQRDYAGARALLLALGEDAPGETGLGAERDLYLGIASYHTGELGAARAALERALARSPDRAEAHLYLGIVRYEAGDDEAAIASLLRARELDAERVDPMASYYAGVVRARTGDRDAAAADLERAAASDPGGPWAEKARRASAILARRDRAVPWQVELAVGIERDDNVLLRGEDETLPEEISDEADERLIWRARGSTPLVPLWDGRVGVSGDYFGSAHRDIEGFDVQFPTVSLWWQRRIGSRSATRLEYELGLAWVDESAYFTRHVAGPAFVHTWPEAGRTMGRVRALYYDYRHAPADLPDGSGAPGDPCPVTTPAGRTCGAPGVDESHRRDRTGAGYEIVARHEWRVPGIGREVALKPGVRFVQYLARGSEASYLRLEPGLGVEWELPLALRARTDASFAWRPYSGATSLPEAGTATAGVQFQPVGKKRRDRITRVGVSLERSFLGGVVAELRYAFTDNASNLRLAEYRRHVVGAQLKLRLGARGFFGRRPAESQR